MGRRTRITHPTREHAIAVAIVGGVAGPAWLLLMLIGYGPLLSSGLVCLAGLLAAGHEAIRRHRHR